MNTEKIVNLYISVAVGDNTDKEDLEELSRELIDELNELESIQSVEPVPVKEIPEGAKGVPIDWGTILLTMTQAGIISGLITVLNSWLARDKRRTLELKLGEKSLKLTGISKKEQQKLVEWFQSEAGFRLDR